ncbi:MAG: C25 family cysteine peptidase, partial [Marinilabiliaceae bacterium]|nr:C25 family cysteine peptidase [Marinilabiliaceae bacterium]
MKRLLILFGAILMAAAINAQTIELFSGHKGISRSNDQFSGFEATFSFDQIESVTITGTERGTFSALTIAGAYQAGEIGTPELPVFRKMIQIPVGATPHVLVKNFTSEEFDLETYGFYPVFPTQPSVRKDQTEIPFIYDEKAYGIDDYNYSVMAEVEILGQMRGIILGMVTIRPLQYNPVAHTIIAHNDIEIEVNFKGGDYKKTEELFVNTFSPHFLKHYEIAFNSGVTRDVYDDHPDLFNVPVRMLVVANRMFETTLQPWIEWKTQKGFIMDVNYTDVIGTTAAAIKTFIHNKYNTGVGDGTAPTFIILVGDTPQVPASQTGSYTSKATDLYYARTASSGFFPDMYYSRMSAQTTQQLANQIEKILYYEKYQFADPTYLDNVLLIAGADGTWNPRVGKPQIDYATNYYYNTANGYASIHKYWNAYSGCYTHLNNVGFANYTAHCNETLWGDPSFTVAQIATLTNVNKYFVAMGNCCLAADFGYSGNGGICFGEAMMSAQQKGAVGYIGSSPSSYWGEDFHFTVGAYSGNLETVTTPTLTNTTTGCYDFMFRDVDFNTLCSHVLGGNLAVQYAHNNPGYTTHVSAPYYWEAYNVLGDGSLMPYNGQAAVNTVSHLPIVPIGMNEYEVSAVPGSYVAISKDGILHGVGLADALGVAAVQLDPPILSGGDVDIVVTRNQYQPYMIQIPAAALEGPYIVYDSYETVNESALTYISENSEIAVTLKNVGNDPTEGPLSVVVSCDDPQITINNTTAQVNEIIQDGETAVVNFNVSIDNAIVDKKVFPVTVTITQDDEIWESTMRLTAYAPKFSLEKVLINGVEGGNLEAGEIVTITAVIENKGGADAYNVVGDIGINSPYVNPACDEVSGTAQDMPLGESLNFDFVVITDSNMPFGHEASLAALLTANYGITYSEVFTAS